MRLRLRIAHLMTRNATTNGDSQNRAAATRVSHPPWSRIASIKPFYAARFPCFASWCKSPVDVNNGKNREPPLDSRCRYLLGKLMRIILYAGISILFVATLVSCEKRGADEDDTLAVRADNVIPYAQKHANMLKMREFLWNHWLQRRPATLLFTSVSKEGSKYRSEYKIIILPGNTLTLKVASIHDRIGAQGQVIPKPEGGYEAYTVERVQSDSPIIGPESKVTVLRSDAVVPPESYRLRFRGWGGDVIDYF